MPSPRPPRSCAIRPCALGLGANGLHAAQTTYNAKSLQQQLVQLVTSVLAGKGAV